MGVSCIGIDSWSSDKFYRAGLSFVPILWVTVASEGGKVAEVEVL